MEERRAALRAERKAARKAEKRRHRDEEAALTSQRASEDEMAAMQTVGRILHSLEPDEPVAVPLPEVEEVMGNMYPEKVLAEVFAQDGVVWSIEEFLEPEDYAQ